MNKVRKKISPIYIASLVFASTTIIFGILSFINVENRLIQIIMQASLCIMTLFNGLHSYVNQKQRALGLVCFGAAGFLLFVIIYTIFVGVSTKAL